MPIPSQQKALLLQNKHEDFTVGTRGVPQPARGDILVKNEAVALNPLDWKIQTYGVIVQDYPAVIGFDAAGVVEGVGEDVENMQMGDRVLYTGDIKKDRGTYQEYTLVPAKLVAKIPPDLSFDEAAALPLATCTAAVGLYHGQFDPPWAAGGRGRYAGTPLVVMGGTSSNGSLAIQWARLSGFSPVIVTASPHNAERLHALGATHVLDRAMSAKDLLAEVTRIVGCRVPAVYDSISSAETQNAAFELLAPGGRLLIVGSYALSEKNKSKMRERGDGRAVVSVVGIVQIPFFRAFGELLFAELGALLKEGHFKPLALDIIPGGLRGIPSGLEMLKRGEVSATKLVVRPSETP